MGQRGRETRGESTRRRILQAAVQSFGTTGVEGTSLDDLASDLGLRKQSILYHFPSKAELLDSAVGLASNDLVDALEKAVGGVAPGFERVEAVVKAVFRLAMRRPEMLGLLREVTRLGEPASNRLTQALEPLAASASAFLEAEMDRGTFRRSDPKLLLVSCYSTVIGVATEVEVLRAVGIEPSLRSAAVRRRELLGFLHSALVGQHRSGSVEAAVHRPAPVSFEGE